MGLTVWLSMSHISQLVMVSSRASCETTSTPPWNSLMASPSASMDSMSLAGSSPALLQVVGGLVEDEQMRLAERDLREGDATLLSAGEEAVLDGGRVALEAVAAQQVPHRERCLRQTYAPARGRRGTGAGDTRRARGPWAACRRSAARTCRCAAGGCDGPLPGAA